MSWLCLALLLLLAAGICVLIWYGYREGYDTSDIGTKLARKNCPKELIDEMVKINEENGITHHKLPAKRSMPKDVVAPRRKITLGILSVGVRPFKDYTVESVRLYAEKHGYDFMVRDTPYEIPDKIYKPGIKQPNWQKLFWIRDLLDSTDSEYVAWLDDDILVTNPNISLEAIMQLEPGKDFYISCDKLTGNFIFPFRQYLNSGVFVVKNNAAGRQILDAAIATYYTHEGWYWAPFNDQTAIEYVYFTGYGQNFGVLPHGILQTIDSSGEWESGDFLCHLAGQKEGTRVSTCKKLIRRGYVPGLN